ncbi:phosphopantetheine-binding protein [Streptomyces sp. M10(2022)]
MARARHEQRLPARPAHRGPRLPRPGHRHRTALLRPRPDPGRTPPSDRRRPQRPWVRSHVLEPVRQVRRLAGRLALAEGTDLGALYRSAAHATDGDHWVLRAAGGAERPTTPSDDEAGERLRALESRLAGLWRDVLGRDRVGPDENFFDLGGNSLLLVAAQSAVNREFGCELPVVGLFAHPPCAPLPATWHP